MCAGRPAGFIGDPDGEISRILRDSDAGVVIGPGGDEGLADALVRLQDDPELAANARRVFEARFDKGIRLGRCLGARE